MKALWWILGLLAIGGGSVVIYSKSTGRNILKMNACINDLKFSDRDNIHLAVEERDLNKLKLIKANLINDGFDCAAEEVQSYIDGINGKVLSEAKAAKCPTKEQLNILLEDIVDKKITKEQANKVLKKLKDDECDDADIVEDKIKTAYFEGGVKKPEEGLVAKASSLLSGKLLTDDKSEKLEAEKASKISEKESSEWYNTVRAKENWPGIMLVGSDVPIQAKVHAIALGLKKDGKEYLVADSLEEGKTHVAVKLQRTISGYMPPSPSDIRGFAKYLKDMYGPVYKQAVYELELIEYSIRLGNLPDPGES